MSYGIVVGRDGGCLDQLFPGLTSQSLPSSVNSSPEVSPVSYACRGSGGTLRPFLSDGGAERTRLEVRKIGVKFGSGPSLSAVLPSLFSFPATPCSPSLLDSPAPNAPRSPAPGETEKKLEPDHSWEPRAFWACPLLLGVRKF